MKTFEEMEYHPVSENVVGILCNKTQNNNPLFFRVLVGYYFSLVASMMRATIVTHDRGDIPINLYALNLGTSGSGKGFSTNIMENEVINQFRKRYLEETFELLSQDALPRLATERARRKGTDPDVEMAKVQKEFDALGSLVFSFDSGTPAAVKQLRHKLLMSNAGSMNLQIDEIGSNLLSNLEVLTAFLELYDVGRIKTKLIKNTVENSRNEEIVGNTPTNMLLFGTPAKLLNGSKTEEELYSMLETGYARRCFFGYSKKSDEGQQLTKEQVYDMLTDKGGNVYLSDLADKLEGLADMVNMNKKLVLTKDTTLLLIEYRLKCEAIANTYPEHEEIKKAEIAHRYFKVLKLAGAYAFIDESPEVTESHIYNAIKLAEESGDAFNQLLNRDRNWVRLAKYIAACKRNITQADLAEDLPFYKGAMSQKQEMMTLAIAWGYKNNIVIKKEFSDGIEFLRGETLEVTDLEKMVVAWSTDIATDYSPDYAPWDQLHKLTQTDGLHWVTHHMHAGHRQEDNAIPGFNLLVLDVDGTCNISTAALLLKDYKFMIYTTKRHTADEHRFRIILPLNFTLKLDAKEYKEFIANVREWMPFEVDEQTGQRARKWLSHDGAYQYNDGELFDALPFIPKTSKNEERKIRLQDQQSMDNLERWVINHIGDGNRNSTLLRYAMILVDGGFELDVIRVKVLELNNKIADKLEEAEIYSTIMVTVTKAIAKRTP